MYILILLLPLIIFFILISFGRFIGRRGSIFVAVYLLVIAWFLSFYYFILMLYKPSIVLIGGYSWISSGLLEIYFEFLFDSLSTFMILLVLSISLIVHIYSIDYMYQDPCIQRFLSYLSLFTFFMLLLVTSNNYVQLFMGWEGVGLCSYLLISFWYTRLNACKSALKAVLYNKIGDCFLLLAMTIIFFLTSSLNFQVTFSVIPFFKNNLLLSVPYYQISIINLLSFTIVVAAMGKSAQFFLHPWLADAMEGPTPVSALIHAATMVTAGIYLIMRCSYILEYSTIAPFISFIGSLTILFASIIAIFQFDLKKIIAYSTGSQLGYMFIACAFSGYKAAFFHLFTHGFFKALLFLTAGLLIHAFYEEQDIRKMGGLLHLVPFSFCFFYIGSLTLMGIPFLSGYFSKDFILELLYSGPTYYNFFCFHIAIISTSLTTIYSFKLFYFVFLSEPLGYKSSYKGISLRESSRFSLLCLILLAVSSIFIGYLLKDSFIGLNSTSFYFSIYEYSSNSIIFNNLEFFISISNKLLPIYFFFLGLLVSFIIIISVSPNFLNILNTISYTCFVYFNQAWFVNYVYNLIGLKIYQAFIHVYFFDKIVLELTGPLFINNFVKVLSKFLFYQESYLTFTGIYFYFLISLFLLFSF